MGLLLDIALDVLRGTMMALFVVAMVAWCLIPIVLLIGLIQWILS